jgi:hypothetical protein
MIRRDTVAVFDPASTQDSMRSESYITTDGQSASLSWNKAPIRGSRPDLYYYMTATSLLMWGALSDERTGIQFTIAAGPCERNHFPVRVPWDSWPYFTVSDSRLSFSVPPTTRKDTVEVFDTASTRNKCVLKLKLQLNFKSCYERRSVGLPLGIKHPSGA